MEAITNQYQWGIIKSVARIDIGAIIDSFLANLQVAQSARHAEPTEGLAVVQRTVLLELAAFNESLFFTKTGFEFVLAQYHAIELLRSGRCALINAS